LEIDKEMIKEMHAHNNCEDMDSTIACVNVNEIWDLG
jgi:hypothetical protein